MKKIINKILSITLSVCLVITAVQNLAFSMPAPVAPLPAAMLPSGQIDTNIIPFNVGKVTETLYNGDGRVLVTIQDLHSHKQTQENINRILKILDEKYGIKNIWLEGASGQLDTSWLAGITDTKLKEKIIQTLLDNGKLTGAELFSVQTKRTKIIKGLENKEVYLKNFDRLNEIYNKKSEIASYLPKLKAILDAKTKNYYSTENKKINLLREKNLKGEIKSDRYYEYILRAANKANISLSNYDQIAKYAFLLEKQKNIKFKNLNKEITKILKDLKEFLNYKDYKSLLEKLNNKETEIEFYEELKKFAEDKNLLGKYKELSKFLDYIAYNKYLNPLLLAQQEEELTADIQTSFARTGYEKDVLFLKKYFRLTEEYLNNKITADEYRYFKNNETKFKQLWLKYVDVDGIIDIKKYFDLFNDFYEDNVDRNRYFIENITGINPVKEKNAVTIKASEEYNSKAIEELSKEKDGIDVVITGGFHTRGLSRLFEEEKINYVVITPTVTEETLTCEKLYEKMFREEYSVVKEKFAAIPTTSLINDFIERLNDIENIRLEGNTLFLDLNDGRYIEIFPEEGEENFEIDIEQIDEQAKLAAATFLNLQMYLKIYRENNRKKAASEEITDVSHLEEVLEAQIEQITDKDLRESFIERYNSVLPKKSLFNKKISIAATIVILSLSILLTFVPNILTNVKNKQLNEKFAVVTEITEDSSAQDKENVQRLKELMDVFNLDEHDENFYFYMLDIFLDDDFLRIFFNDNFVEFSKIQDLTVFSQYDLIKESLIDKLNSAADGNFQKLDDEEFNKILIDLLKKEDPLYKKAYDIAVQSGIFSRSLSRSVQVSQDIYEHEEKIAEEDISDENIQKLMNLISALYDKKISSQSIDKENNWLALQILFNENFITFCEQQKGMSDILQQYNFAISVSRKIAQIPAEDLKNMTNQQFDLVLKETLSYYEKVFEIASQIDMFGNNMKIFSIHNDEKEKGEPLFSPRGIQEILNILNITPSAFESTELSQMDVAAHQQAILDYLDKVATYVGTDDEKVLFVFDGHGDNDGFIFDDIYFMDSEYIVKFLVKAHNNGVNLENRIFYFSSCGSYDFADNIIEKLKDAGIDKLPQIIAISGKETENGYTIVNHGYGFPMSNLEYSIFSELTQKSEEEIAAYQQHFTLTQAALIPMQDSNHTVFVTNDKIKNLNDEYAKTINNILGSTGMVVEPYSELQTQNTLQKLEKIAKFFRLKKPEEFRHTAIGTAIGVLLEQKILWDADFLQMHTNITPEMERGLALIKNKSLTAATNAAKKFSSIPALEKFAYSAALNITEFILHYRHNRTVASALRTDKAIKSGTTIKDVSVKTLQNIVLNSNDWLQLQTLKISSLFTIKPTVLAVVESTDTKAIEEAQALADSGIKVNLIILNSDKKHFSSETGKVLYGSKIGTLYELYGQFGNLTMFEYERTDGNLLDEKIFTDAILEDIANANITGKENKVCAYISPSLYEGQESKFDEYIKNKTLLSVSTTSIKGALAQGFLNYGNTKVQTLSDMVIQPVSIYGIYKAKDVSSDVIYQLKDKGIENIIIDMSGESQRYISMKISFARSNGMNVVLFGEAPYNFKADNIVTAVYGNPAENQRQIMDYVEALGTTQNLSDVIVNVSKNEKENLIITPESMESLIKRGASIAFDGDVLRQVSKESTSENGITMLDIIKAMFADTPERKAEKERFIGLKSGRNIAVKLISQGIDINNLKNIDFLYKMLQEEEYGLLPRTAIVQNEAVLKELLIGEKGNLQANKSEILGRIEGFLQVAELWKVLPDIKDTDRVDNMNELMERLIEYRLLTGRSFDKQEGENAVRSREEDLKKNNPGKTITHDMIMNSFKDTLSDKNRAVAISGIIELLLAENLQLSQELERAFDIDTAKLHALLSAA